MMGYRAGFVALLVSITGSACAKPLPPVHVAPTAPKDAPLGVDAARREELERLLEPCRQKAMASYPDARARFLTGLPEHHTMFIVTRLRDAAGRREQVFVAVDGIDGDRVKGRVWNDRHVIEGFQRGQAVTIPESEIVDWMVARPDGTEEGNWMGRFIDALQATGRPPAGICDR